MKNKQVIEVRGWTKDIFKMDLCMHSTHQTTITHSGANTDRQAHIQTNN